MSEYLVNKFKTRILIKYLLKTLQISTLLQKNNKNITKIIRYIMNMLRRNVNKMIGFNKMWKNMKTNKKCPRYIKEVSFGSINLNEYVIIDVRSRREFREYHLNNAINIPLSEINRSIGRYVGNKQKKILVCCEYGARSKKAAEQLENMGYTEVYNLKGGLENI